ncbi:MAG TPA: PQQ-binding-like beta-propeller repeat protein [Roseiflexaceae bacterium]|nr:PQQ-binding-like beta-propeller repeat protein [Roseiflexaceae bacterium]
MSNANDPKATYCPSCGAPVTMGEKVGICDFCGTVVERPRNTKGAPFFDFEDAKVEIHTSTYTYSHTHVETRSKEPDRGCTLLLLGVALLVGAIMVLAGRDRLAQLGSELGIIPRSGAPANGPISGTPVDEPVSGAPTSGPVISLPPERNPLEELLTPQARLNVGDFMAVIPRDAPADDLLAYLSTPEDIDPLALIHGASRKPIWQTPALSKDAKQGLVAIDAKAVYATDGDTLRALRLSDGTEIWQTALVAGPDSSCEKCLQVHGDRVVVLQKDGSLQGFDISNGAQVWSKRLKDSPRRLAAAGGKLVMVLPPPEGADNAVIELIDPATGEVARTITPNCAGPDEFIPPRFNQHSPVLISPGGGSLFVVFTIFDACIQRWDVDKDALVWESRLPSEAAPSSWDAADTYITARTIFVINDGVLSALDTATGAVKTLVQDEDHNLRVVAATDTTVIVKTAPDWDSRKQALWGIDRASGEQRWQLAIEGEEYRPDGLFGDWDARLRPQGLALIQVPEENNQILFDLLDPETGVSAGRQITELSESSPVSWDAHWSDRISWWQIGGSLYAIDLATGKVAYQIE